MGWAQHCRVLGELEPTVRLHVAYGDISVVRLGDAVAERLERLDGLLDPLLEHGTRIDPRPEVPAPKARRGAQHVMDFGDGLDVGVDVERRHGVLVAEDRLERLDIAALADPLRCERVAKAVERDQLVVGAHEAVGLRERLERPADIACRREGRARLRQDVAVPDLDRPGKAADLADSHPRVQGEYDRPLILGGPIESELLSGILFAHDFEKVSGLATKGEA